MAKRNVNIVVKARDEASRKLRGISGAAGGLGSALRKAALAGAAFFGGRALLRFARQSVEDFGRQESAVLGLRDALELLGTGDQIENMQEFADEIQRTTEFGDELILELLTMGATMGKLNGGPLKAAAKAAIGLSKAFGVELTAAMRLVARAAIGDTSSLTRYGIKLDETLSDQEKFNKVLAIGTENFSLATSAINQTSVILKQMQNEIGDVREEIGGALAPVVRDSAIAIKNWASDNKEAIGDFAGRAVVEITFVKDVIAEMGEFMRDDFTGFWEFGLDGSLTAIEVWGKSVNEIVKKTAVEMEKQFAVSFEQMKLRTADFFLDISDFFVQLNFGGRANFDKFAEVMNRGKLRDEIINVGVSDRERFFEKQFPDFVIKPWTEVMEDIKQIHADGFKELVDRMPPELRKGFDDALAKRQAGLASLRNNALPPSLGGTGGGGAATVADVLAAITGRPRGVRPVEARFLGRAPSADRRRDPIEQVAKNTARMVEIETRSEKIMRILLSRAIKADERLDRQILLSPSTML